MKGVIYDSYRDKRFSVGSVVGGFAGGGGEDGGSRRAGRE